MIKRHSCLDNKETAQVLGGLHYSAARKSAASLEKALSKDKKPARLVDKFLSNAKT